MLSSTLLAGRALFVSSTKSNAPRYVTYGLQTNKPALSRAATSVGSQQPTKLYSDFDASITLPKLADYKSLCNLLITLAKTKRRPTPLLKAASIELCKIQDDLERPKVEIMIATLGALVTLSYPDRALISKLMNDLTEIIKLDELNPETMTSLLRSIGHLRWRPDDILELFFNYISEHGDDCKNIDHNVIIALFHIAALVNYRPSDIQQFYNQCMRGHRELLIDKFSRKWLNYVWSLAALNLAEESHITSVLSSEFYLSIETLSAPLMIGFSDALKLLNLHAIAEYEFKLDGLDFEHEELITMKAKRSMKMEKFASTINEALSGLFNSSELRRDIQTPFGFRIDCEIWLNENLEPIPLDESSSFERIIALAKTSQPKTPNGQKCALIYASYDDTIANTDGEVVGYKKIIARILKNFGYETIFLPEILITQEKTSADLSNRIKTMIRTSVGGLD